MQRIFNISMEMCGRHKLELCARRHARTCSELTCNAVNPLTFDREKNWFAIDAAFSTAGLARVVGIRVPLTKRLWAIQGTRQTADREKWRIGGTGKSCERTHTHSSLRDLRKDGQQQQQGLHQLAIRNILQTEPKNGWHLYVRPETIRPSRSNRHVNRSVREKCVHFPGNRREMRDTRPIHTAQVDGLSANTATIQRYSEPNCAGK